MDNLTPNAIRVMEHRYLGQDKHGKVTETPQKMFERVGRAVAGGEKEGNRNKWFHTFTNMMKKLDFLPNSPAFSNAGRSLGQLSACFVLPIEDSIGGIFTTIRNAALVHQSGGGTGFDFSGLRPAGSRVDTTNGVASGPVSFLRVFNAATREMKQGGVRRGANLGVLRVDHPDILEFIQCKNIEGENENFNISVAITNKFMQCLETGDPFELVWNENVVNVVNAQDIWDEIIDSAWKNGEPGIIFIDVINDKNILKGKEVIYACNPCGEQPLPAYGTCNLGSINLANHVKAEETEIEGSIVPAKNIVNWDKLKRTIWDAVRFLDNMIDVTTYPIPEFEVEAGKWRRIGLGIMGLADLLIKLKIPYGSAKGRDVAGKIASFLSEESIKASEELGKEKGGIRKPLGRRNALTTTIAPTGSLSILANCSSGCEPVFSFNYDKKCIEDGLSVVHPLYARFMEEHGEDAVLPDYFVTAKDISVMDHIEMQAALQQHIHSGISKTINAPNKTTLVEVDIAFMTAYKSGCKSTTFYRDGSRELQGHTDKTEAAEYADTFYADGARTKERPKESAPLERPEKLHGYTIKINTPRGKLYMTVNEVDGEPFEVFLKIGKSGKEDLAYSEALGRLVSLVLRSGVQVRRVVRTLMGISGGEQVWNKGIPINSVPDAIAWILKEEYLDKDDVAGEDQNPIAPICQDCGEEAIYAEGCVKCGYCGWTKC